MKILLFGKTGQVATELQRQAVVTALGRDQADLTDPAACAEIIRKSDADAIINAAAYTAVDLAESEPDLANLVNGTAPTEMAKAAADIGAPFIHISTDYVFNGTGTTPWRPDDPARPINAYGHSKLLGENGVVAARGVHAILRTSWIFSAHQTNFVKTMLRLSESKSRLSIVADQIGGPTPAADVAAACLRVAHTLAKRPASSGLYHCSGGPDVSWADFARTIFDMAGRDVRIDDIPTSAFPTAARRPTNSRMDCRDLEQVFGISRPIWQQGLAVVLQELGL